MSFLARKITLTKWKKVGEEISADSITYCLRTSVNSLSLWIVEEEKEMLIQEVVLALASTGDKLDKMDIVLIDDQFFNENAFDVQENAGDSKVLDLNHKHRDIVALTLNKMVLLTTEISKRIDEISALNADELSNYMLVRSFSKKEVTTIIRNAVDKERVKYDDLSDSIKKELDKPIKTKSA